MANVAKWIAGAQATYGTLINSADMASMTNGQTVLSSVADIANDTNLDLYMDISYQLVISSNTIAAGANFAFWRYTLNQNGTIYGDGQLTAGTPASVTPAFPPVAISPIPAVASTTNMYGRALAILMPPGSFRIAIQNNSGFALTSGTQTVKYRTYNLNLNA